VLVRLLQSLPSGVVDALARGVAACAYALGIRRKVTLDNLAHAFPERTREERRAIARAAYANMARVVVDALRTLGAPRAQLLAEVQVDDFGPVERALARGKGLLVATAHLGSWELFGAAMAQRVPLHAVVRPLRGGVNARLVEARERAGLRLIPGRGALSGMVAALRKNEVVAMLVDQAIGGKHALFVPFFGRPAATTPALSMAALRTRAPTLLVIALRDGGRLRFRVEGPFEVSDSGDRRRDLFEHTARVTAALERLIREAPAQWLWLHRRWKLSPPPGDVRLLTSTSDRGSAGASGRPNS
jgi:KDO2-lipid IV(A) lauroyltransferase